MKKKVLLIITGSFPYNYCKEDSFIMPEIKYYSSYFDKVVFVPNYKIGEKAKLYNDIDSTDTLANLTERGYSFKHLFTYEFILLFKEVILNFFTKRIYNFNSIKYILSHFLNAKICQEWLNNYLTKFTDYNITIYTYWCDHNTTGICFEKVKKRNSISVVSRSHGADLYEERNNFGFIPFRKFVIGSIDRFIPISNSGLQYINALYPKNKSSFIFSRLGVKKNIEFNELAIKSNSGLTIVSCSSVINLKRVDLIYTSLKFFSDTYKVKVDWHHFGGGSDLELLNNAINSDLTDCNLLDITLHGNVENNFILNFYKEFYIDLFINLSIYEGIPVSIMECQSFGIPVIATNVGGMNEIVYNGLNGFLLKQNPSIHEVAEIIYQYTKERKSTDFQKNSYNNWLYNFNENINFPQFLTQIQF